MLTVFRRPGARWILALHAGDLLLEYASSVALMVLVYDATQAPIAVAAMLFAKQILPGVLLATADARLAPVDPRAGLVAAYAVRVVAFAALALVGVGAALYPLAFVAGLAGLASRVVIRATVARSASGPAFRSITAAQNLVFAVMALVGPALGAAAASALSSTASIAVWAAVAVVLATAATTMPRALRAPSRGSEAATPEVAAPQVSGGPVPVWSMLALGAVLACAFAMDEPALLAYTRQALGGGTEEYGLILVVWGAGAVLGGVAYSRLGIGRPVHAIIGGVTTCAIGYLGLGVASTLEVACVAALVGGVGNGSWWVALVTAVLERAPQGEEARVSARLEIIATAMPAAGIVVGGVVAQWVDPRITLLAPGVVALVALAAWIVVVRITRRSPVLVVAASSVAHESAAVPHADAIAWPAPLRAEEVA